eukprot:6401751-Lingulodinium_polyedra.AAC.1
MRACALNALAKRRSAPGRSRLRCAGSARWTLICAPSYRPMECTQTSSLGWPTQIRDASASRLRPTGSTRGRKS